MNSRRSHITAMNLPNNRLPIPLVPGPGTEKVRDAGRAARIWRICLAVLAVILVAGVPLGLGRVIDSFRRDFVAMRLVQEAATDLNVPPVDRTQITAFLDRAIELTPGNSTILRRSADLYMRAGAYQQAVQAFDGLDELDLPTEISLGHSLLLAGDIERGKQVLVRAEREVGEQNAAGDGIGGGMPALQYANYLNNIGYAYAEGNAEIERAYRLSAEAARLAPLQPAYIDTYGWVLYHRADYREALFYLERAVRLAGKNNTAETYYHLGAAYARNGQVQPAADALNEALERDPQYEPASEELRKLGYVLPQPDTA